MILDTNAKAGTTTWGRVPVVDPQPCSPRCLTFEAQNTVADVAKTAIIDHGSHNVDIPVKGHFQEAGQPRRTELRMRRAVTELRVRGRSDNRWWSKVLGKRSCNHMTVEFPQEGAGGGGREVKEKETETSDGGGKRGISGASAWSEQHPGDRVGNLLGETVTVSESQIAIIDMMSGGDNLLCDRIQRSCKLARVQRVKMSGVCTRGQSKTEIAQKEPAHGYQWKGHPFVTQRGQAPTNLTDRRAKTGCQSPQEWGQHVFFNRRVMRISTEDRARNSQPEGGYRVEEQAPVERESGSPSWSHVGQERQKRTVGLSNTIAAEVEQ